MLSDLESDIKEVKCRGKSDKSQEHFYQQFFNIYIYIYILHCKLTSK